MNNKELFYEQQKLVMSHLANNAQEILNLNLPVVKNSEFPNIEHTTKKLIEYCQEHSIKLVRPEKSREDFTQSPSV